MSELPHTVEDSRNLAYNPPVGGTYDDATPLKRTAK